jgi:hypothetical protein
VTSAASDLKPPVFFHLQLVGKISTVVAATAAAGFLLVVTVLVSDKGGSYRALIGAYGLARENLAPALLVFALVMGLVAGIATWLVTLYASFSFAGPLYRLSRNLELVTAQGPVVPVPLRGTDRLQRECDSFRDAVAKLREHYRDLRVLVGQIDHALQEGSTDHAVIRQLSARLQETASRVRL